MSSDLRRSIQIVMEAQGVSETVVYHGSNRKDFNGVLVPRNLEANPTWRGLNYIGAWFTAEPAMAKNYSAMPDGHGPVYAYELPEGARFWPAGKNHFGFLVSFTHLMGRFIPQEDIDHISRYRIEKHKDVRATPGMDAKPYERTARICLNLIQNHEFVCLVRDELLSHKYSGIVWQDSDIDLQYYPDIKGHDVYLIFHKESIHPVEQVEAPMLKESLDRLDGWWITNTGEMIDVDYDNDRHHADIAAEAFGESTDEWEPEWEDIEDFQDDPDGRVEASEEAITTALEHGWIRGCGYEHSYSVEYRNPPEPARKALLTWLRAYGPAYKRIEFSTGFSLQVFEDYRKAIAFVRGRT